MEIWEKYLKIGKEGESELEIPEYFNYGFDIIDKHAERTPEKIALVWTEEAGIATRRFIFDDLSFLSNKFGNVLKKLGLQKGDMMLLILPRVPEWHITMLGCIKTGVIPILSITMLTAKDIEYRLNSAEAKAIITDYENAEKIEEIKDKCPSLKTLILIGEEKEGWLNYAKEMEMASSELEELKTRSDDPLLLFFTSGTTGSPKMVLHKQSYALAHLITAKFWHSVKANDLHWTMSDTGWAKAGWACLGQWIIGSAVFMQQVKGKFSPESCLKSLEKFRITTFCAAPTVFRELVKIDLKERKFPHLRRCCSAGEPLDAKTIEMWGQETGLEIYDGYGQTETPCIVANTAGMKIKPGSMGKPTPGFYVSIIDEDGNELPPEEPGLIAVRVKPEHPAGIFDEYFKNPEKTAEVFKNEWYITGDIGVKDKDNYIQFLGRDDDIIKSAGYRIGPFEVENPLREHPAVAEVAAVGAPHMDRHEIVKAFIVLTPGYKGSAELTKELQNYMKKTTGPYKYPREIEFVKELPKNISGKILRRELKNKEWQKEVERVLKEHPLVFETAVVIAKHEIIKAFVVLAPGCRGSEYVSRELQNYVKKNTAWHREPREIEFVNKLPSKSP